VRGLELGERMGGICGRVRRRGCRVQVANAALLDGFCMSVGGSAASAGALEGTRNLKSCAAAAWRPRLVAL
jgi:hypothetical protein